MCNLPMKMASAIGLCLLTISAGVQSGADDPHRPVITSAQANFTNNTLTVIGTNFGIKTPSVTLNATALTVASSSNTQVVANLPAGILPGSYGSWSPGPTRIGDEAKGTMRRTSLRSLT